MRYIKILFLFTVFLFSTNHIKAQACITPPTNGSDDQTVCVNSPIVDIIYTLASVVSSAAATGLPPGVIGVFTPGQFRISGTPTVPGNYSYSLIVVTTGLCTGGNTTTGKITVNAQPVPTIAGPVTACINSIGNVYTTQSGMSNYIWAVSAGGTITAGGGITNRTVTITWNAAGAQTVSVNYANANGCTATSPTVYNVTVNPLPVPTLTGNAAVCVNSTGNVYTTDAGMTSYAWSVTGGTITAGGGANSRTATVTWTTAGPGTVSVNYVNSNGCTAASPTVYNVTVNPLPVPTITGPPTACLSAPGNVYITEPGMSAYDWTVSSGGTITAGGGSTNNSVTITWSTIGAKTVRVNYTNGNGCTATSATVFNVTVNALPVVDAGPNVIIPNGTNTALNGTVTGTGPFTYSWTPAAQLVNPLVVDPITVVLSSTTVFTLTATSTTTTCSNSDVVTITVAGNPLSSNPTATPSTVCAGATVQLNAGASGGSGIYTYSWTSVPAGFTSTISNPVVNPLVTTTYRVAVFDGFTTVNAQVIVTVNALPVATASNNGPVCAGTTLSLTGGPAGMLAYSWSGPNGYSNATISPVVSTSATVAMAGVYYLTVINSNGCQSIAASTNVTVNASPVATAINNGPVCVGSPLRLTGGPSGMTSYSWTGPNSYTSNGQSPTVSLAATSAMAGKYILTVANAAGCQDTASTKVVVNTLPAATALNNGPVCSGKPLILTGGPASMASYLWIGPNSFISTLQSPTVSLSSTIAMAGDYTLTVTNSSGCSSLATTSVIVNQTPVATAANNGPVCVGSPLTLAGGPASMTTYLWTGPNSFTSNQISPVVSATSTLAQAGIYTLTVTSAAGCQDTATTRAYVYAVPVSNAGTGGTECDLNFLLHAVPSAGIGLWSVVTGPGTAIFTPNPNSPTATVTVSAYGTYTFRWTETNGPCSSSSVVTVIFYQQPLANAGAGGNECDLDFVLNALPSLGIGTWTMISGTGNAVFAPSANTPSAVVTVSEYGTKLFTWTEVNGICTGSDTITVNFYQQPTANAGTGGNNCGLEFNFNAIPSLGTGTWTMESGPGSATFLPNPNLANANVTVNAYGTYVFRWTEVNGTCSSSATISVTFIEQPRANGGLGGDECDLNFALNAVQGSVPGIWTKIKGPGNATFSPNPNQHNAIVTVTQFGSYDFAWTEVNSMCSSSDIITVRFHDAPPVNAGTDMLLCKGRSAQLIATGTGTFHWTPTSSLNNPNISNPLATPEITTLYTVMLIDPSGCINSDQVNVEVRVQPVANAGPDQVLEFMFETNFEAAPLSTNQTGVWTILNGYGDISNKNSPNSLVSDLSLETNSFIWTVSNGVCPVSSDTVNIEVNNLIIPTLITPNLDGNNDFFVIKGIESFGKTSLTVFNRWGGRVYENKEYDNSWDGVNENGDPLPDDTYFFMLKPENSKTIKSYVVIRR
jgi:trimeric autotransporter adhesin